MFNPEKKNPKTTEKKNKKKNTSIQFSIKTTKRIR